MSEKYTVAELKYILKENGLKVSGRKPDLVERVLPILNAEASEEAVEEVKEEVKEETVEAEIVEAEEKAPVDLTFPDTEEALSSILALYGLSYDDLSIKDIEFADGKICINGEAFIQNGLSMSDSTMSIINADPTLNLTMNIPEVAYSDFESTIFRFKDLDLNLIPTDDSLEFKAALKGLDIMTDLNNIILKGLDFAFKSFPDRGVEIGIDIDDFIYPNFYNTSFNFENLDFNMAIGVDGQSIAISVNLPALDLLNKDYRVKLSDLSLNLVLSDLQLSDLDLSIAISDFHYTNFDDVVIYMEDIGVSLEHIPDTNSFNVLIGLSAMDAVGLNSFDALFPMMEITGVNFNSKDSDSLINFTGLISPIDLTQIDLLELGALLGSGFDLDAYTRNMAYYPDIASEGASDLGIPGLDLGAIVANCDYSCLGAIELNLTGLLDSADIDLSDLGIDLSDYDISSIKLSDLIGAVGDSEFVMSAIPAVLNIFSLDLTDVDVSGLIADFDEENFDISSLLASLNLSSTDIAAILDILDKSDIDLGAIFAGCDISCLDAITLDLTGFIDSLGIDLSAFIDLSEFDLSAVSLTDIIAILNSFEFDMSTISALLKIFGLDIGDLDLEGLIASFDTENFDLSTLLASLNLSDLDIDAILAIFNNPDFDWAGIFENSDLSCLDAITLDLTGLLDSAEIDLSALGIDLSDYDLSSIKLSELIGVFGNLDFDMSDMISGIDFESIDFENIDLEGLIADFDAENFDISTLLESLNLSSTDLSAIFDMFINSDVDLGKVFEGCDYSCLDAIVLNLSGLLDSIGIDLADLGIDLSDYDLSAIKLSELIGILNGFDLDMNTLSALLKIFGIDLEELDLSGLIAIFDGDNFDMTALLSSLNLGGVDISAIVELFDNLGFDFDGMFENLDISCFDAITLDLTGLIDSTGIDLAAFGIDLSAYDLSAIKLSDLIGVVCSSEFIMSASGAVMKLFNINVDDLDFDGLIASFDAENFDISPLLESIELSGFDISEMLEMFDMNGFDLSQFLNQFISSFMENALLESGDE
ncbi:hypothetical protein mru_0041 [Methanobrevibacter ruminantium M1]|uniref:SAP domain-containing protein n=1 Tax=Methanobrevibacter ruminantium (strain ATCC 35063 / DSM 1093 / JCM 13430 / OCM 146 / M1) TaxID=634498 RepID=D3E4J7_METRM|nr:SAP domain-containing protein [Methanobrevibacter ruminantium]ADC45893.1 hypothetical protein mru_0041 [Methanobrevibacter ruminantium M1]